jgi:hypothetical protein
MAGSDESSLANESKQKQAVMDDDDEVMVVEDDEEPKSKTAFFGDEEMSAEQNSKIDSIVDSDANFLSKAPSIEVHKIDMAEPGCVHEVCQLVEHLGHSSLTFLGVHTSRWQICAARLARHRTS